MSDSSNNKKSAFLIIGLLLALAVAAYYFVSAGNKPENAPQPETAITSENAAPAPESVPTTPTEMVVETKTLDLPAAATPDIPVAADASNNPAVEKMMGLRKLGSDDAPIKVVEYSSLTCGHCSAFHKEDFPKIKTDYIDTGKVQFIFKEFPLNKPAVDASKLLRCMPEDKFQAFQNLLFAEQEKWAYAPDYLVPLKQNAKLAGLSETQVDECLGNKDLENRIIGDMKAAGEKYKIQSTPTFIVNDGVKTIVGHQSPKIFVETFDGILGGTVNPSVPATPENPQEHKE